MTIQDSVYDLAKKSTFPSGEFAIEHIQVQQYATFQDCYTYKQIRDALYRMREMNEYKHTGRGVYQWVM